jgi:hypothetical protein
VTESDSLFIAANPVLLLIDGIRVYSMTAAVERVHNNLLPVRLQEYVSDTGFIPIKVGHVVMVQPIVDHKRRYEE